MNASSSAPCPWCATPNSVTYCPGSTVEDWFLVQTTGLVERRERACRLAACNACEFVIEVDAHGNPVNPAHLRSH